MSAYLDQSAEYKFLNFIQIKIWDNIILMYQKVFSLKVVAVTVAAVVVLL